MSFALTERQLLAGHKTVTRRTGWRTLKAGDQLLAVHKCMGLKKGEKQRALATLRVTRVTREPLALVTDDEARKEGFPYMTAVEFISFFCRSMKCKPETEVTRIEFVKEDA
jgi:hypothetical protein